MPVIDFLSVSSPSAWRVTAFCLRLGDTGWVEGQNVTIEYRWAGSVCVEKGNSD
jgi:putative ABC transport system substrate-binding protein